jgi:hypothetical protein
MGKNYIPARGADFGRRFSFLYRYVSQKCAGQPPEWGHIPPAGLTKLGEARAAGKTACGAAIGLHTRVETEAENEAGTAAEGVVRLFVNRYLRCPPVTNAGRAATGVPNHDPIHTPMPKPEAQPEADVAYLRVHVVELNHIRTVGAGKDDPRGGYGVRVFWGVLGPTAERDKFRLAAPQRADSFRKGSGSSGDKQWRQ